MSCRVSDIKLFGSRRISTDAKKYSPKTQRRSDHRIFNGSCFRSMFIAHLIGIIPKFVEAVCANIFITDINTRMKHRKVDIDPERIFRFRLEKSAVVDNVCVYRILECIGKSCLIKPAILVLWKINFKIAPWFWRVSTIAAKNTACEATQV